MDNTKLKQYWLGEEQQSFTGWDFSYINNRIWEEPLPWDYDKTVRSYLKNDFILLDMGTGGGEYLLTLNHPHKNTYATEAYDVNYKLCEKKLKPLGIDIRKVISDESLPFDDEMFDIIINRHESLDISEVCRILKPGGMFITQQVGGQNNKELSNFVINDFKELINAEWGLKGNIAELKNKGFTTIYCDEYFPKLSFMTSAHSFISQR